MPHTSALEPGPDISVQIDGRYGLDSTHIRIDTVYGYVCFFVGDAAAFLAPQITDLEVYPGYQGSGRGKELFLMVIRYLTLNTDPKIPSVFKEAGLGIGLDVSGGFWEHMAEKYHGADLRDGYDGEWTLGNWWFSAEDTQAALGENNQSKR